MCDRGGDRAGRRGEAEDLPQFAREAIVGELPSEAPVLLALPRDRSPRPGQSLSVPGSVRIVDRDVSTPPRDITTLPRPGDGIMSRIGHLR
jgi:hypothetical protein